MSAERGSAPEVANVGEPSMTPRRRSSSTVRWGRESVIASSRCHRTRTVWFCRCNQLTEPLGRRVPMNRHTGERHALARGRDPRPTGVSDRLVRRVLGVSEHSGGVGMAKKVCGELVEVSAVDSARTPQPRAQPFVLCVYDNLRSSVGSEDEQIRLDPTKTGRGVIPRHEEVTVALRRSPMHHVGGPEEMAGAVQQEQLPEFSDVEQHARRVVARGGGQPPLAPGDLVGPGGHGLVPARQWRVPHPRELGHIWKVGARTDRTS